MNRRTALQTGGVVLATGVVGCSGPLQGESTALILHNARATEIEVMVTVTNPQRDEAILNAAVTPVSAGGNVTVSDDIPQQDGHLVTVDVRDETSPAQFRWEQVDEALHGIIHPHEIVFTVDPE